MTNVALILIGIACIITGIARAISQWPSAPKHGERRIVKDGRHYWIETYVAFPSWMKRQAFTTLEEAKADKAAWDELRNRKEEVIEP